MNMMRKMISFLFFLFFQVMEHRWNEIDRGENRSTRGEKAVPVPLFPPQIPHILTRDRTRTSAVGSGRLTVWAMARPYPVNAVWMSRVFYNMIINLSDNYRPSFTVGLFVVLTYPTHSQSGKWQTVVLRYNSDLCVLCCAQMPFINWPLIKIINCKERQSVLCLRWTVYE
jgi:hypothetical protein